MVAFYSSVQAVRDRTGVRPADLGQMNDETLNAFLEDLLTEIADVIDRRIGMSYLEEEVIPPGLSGIAADMAADAIRTMVATRQTPVVRIDDFAVKVIRSLVLTDDVLRRLRLYGRHGLGSITLTSVE